ncbi:A/G-specific adenine glycosylase [Maribacter cobaltidurans]|uniref:Adenine DNA glycosylase n=1 Tax=Maribacter cobaltidurans TaxID=1178778 RepID=A0A223V4X6_9FLAO|nr:A/G-specific adenine glycosylase [Maribacter cobaltidurans]ASV30464.1 A/G-specific adenine glycosylase [Maribacter cobaltidurans]GGD78915.1 A/G-specific adenine glycosylase [Maribacter cobaltidurans]
MSFSDKILAWYHENKRDLPWRETLDPYKIWLSEIILQQTRVAQGMPYYFRFVDAFPTVRDLANAEEEQVLKLWQGLGYYSRARNLHAAAKMVVQDYNGVFPTSYEELLKLKGIGDYTASAISSICFNEPQAVVDGNVYRVLSRYFGVDIPINSSEGIKYFKQLAQEMLPPINIGDYNQGIMEFGAIQCTPKNPNCEMCPIADGCLALAKGTIKNLPVKVGKTKVKKRYFNYLVPISITEAGDKITQLRQRKGKGIWQNLWEFPLLETENEAELDQIEKSYGEILNLKGKPQMSLYNKEFIVHKLSHQHLHTKFWIVEEVIELQEGIAVSDLKKYPVPVLIAEFMKTFKF